MTIYALTTDTNARGNKVHRSFYSGSRYIFDSGVAMKAFGLPKTGWTQFDTDQDASYFGMWIHYEKRLTLCYCEGDVTIVECPTAESFAAEMEDAERWRNEL